MIFTYLHRQWGLVTLIFTCLHRQILFYKKKREYLDYGSSQESFVDYCQVKCSLNYKGRLLSQYRWQVSSILKISVHLRKLLKHRLSWLLLTLLKRSCILGATISNILADFTDVNSNDICTQNNCHEKKKKCPRKLILVTFSSL